MRTISQRELAAGTSPPGTSPTVALLNRERYAQRARATTHAATLAHRETLLLENKSTGPRRQRGATWQHVGWLALACDRGHREPPAQYNVSDANVMTCGVTAHRTQNDASVQGTRDPDREGGE
jgi:hypothetical protein